MTHIFGIGCLIRWAIFHNSGLTCLATILVMQSKTRSEDTVSWKFKDCNNLAKDSSTIFCFEIGSPFESFSKSSLFFNLDRCIRKIVAKSNNKPLPSIWFNLLNKDFKGQLISEWLFDFVNFPKNQQKIDEFLP